MKFPIIIIKINNWINLFKLKIGTGFHDSRKSDDTSDKIPPNNILNPFKIAKELCFLVLDWINIQAYADDTTAKIIKTSGKEIWKNSPATDSCGELLNNIGINPANPIKSPSNFFKVIFSLYKMKINTAVKNGERL